MAIVIVNAVTVTLTLTDHEQCSKNANQRLVSRNKECNAGTQCVCVSSVVVALCLLLLALLLLLLALFLLTLVNWLLLDHLRDCRILSTGLCLDTLG
jgi:uncharacterized protein (UPF0548 family)